MFDGAMARKGYGLNKIKYSLNEQAGRDAFSADEMALTVPGMDLTEAQKTAIKERDVLGVDRRRWQHLLPCQIRRYVGTQHARYWCDANGYAEVEEFKQMLVEAGK